MLFLSMVGTSTLAMFFLTYLNSEKILGHAWFSETRLFMTLLMGSSMMAIMLTFMARHYGNKGMNIAIYLLALALFFSAIWLVRSQATIDEVDYMEGMIPHHSIAILTSERAQIADPRVRALADAIISAQRREIKEMEWLIADIKENGPAQNEIEAGARPVPHFSGSVD